MNELKAGDINLQDYNRFKVDKQDCFCAFFDFMLGIHKIKFRVLNRKIYELSDAMRSAGMIDDNKKTDFINSSQLSNYRSGKLPVPFWAFYPACVLCGADYMKILEYYGFQKSMSETEMQEVIASQKKQIEIMKNSKLIYTSVLNNKLKRLSAEIHKTLKTPAFPKIKIANPIVLSPKTQAAIKEYAKIRQLAGIKDNDNKE